MSSPREPETWTTKEGEVLLVDDMSESHIKNAFKLLIRNMRASREPHELEGPIMGLGGDDYWMHDDWGS